jgi:hypothetical protein
MDRAVMACLIVAAGCQSSMPGPGPQGSPVRALTAATPCGAEGQRACCAFDRPTKPCDPGLVPGPSIPIDSAGTVCDPDPKSVADMNRRSTYGECACNDGVTFSSDGCVRARIDKVTTCPIASAPASPIAMSLFVAGLNHDRRNVGTGVQEPGIEELAHGIVESAADPSSVVVVLSASDSMSCVGGAHNGECLADQLHRATGLNFQYIAWYWVQYPGGEAGPAVITGPRWRPVPGIDQQIGAHIKGSEENAFEVILEDTAHPDKHVPLYVLHTGHSIIAHLSSVVSEVRLRVRAGDQAPLFLGDYNFNYATEDDGKGGQRRTAETAFLEDNFDWLNLRVTCGSPAQTFGLENQLMQVVAGRPGITPQHVGFPAALDGRLVPVALKYTQAPDGSPTSGIDGIWLPDIAHNVLGFDLAYSNPPCPSGRTMCGGQCVDLQADVEHCGSCSNVCSPDPAQCVRGACQTSTPACRKPTTFWCECAGACTRSSAACNAACKSSR